MVLSHCDLEACGSGLAAGLRIREAFSEEEAARQGLTDSVSIYWTGIRWVEEY